MTNNITISKESFLRAGEEGKTQTQREMLFDGINNIQRDIKELKGQMKCRKHANDISWLKWGLRLIYASFFAAVFYFLRASVIAGG